jgi:predicted NUDIX family NTP pyrophosphohydrolase
VAALSAGLAPFRRVEDRVEVLLGHMGGPFWARKDAAAWSFPKGLVEDGEDGLAAARREFAEELGLPAPDGELLDLGEVRLSGGKRVHLWAVEADLDAAAVVPGVFELQWPPGSGRMLSFPEIDRAGWFDLASARSKLTKGQLPFLDRLSRAASRPA